MSTTSSGLGLVARPRVRSAPGRAPVSPDQTRVAGLVGKVSDEVSVGDLEVQFFDCALRAVSSGTTQGSMSAAGLAPPPAEGALNLGSALNSHRPPVDHERERHVHDIDQLMTLSIGSRPDTGCSTPRPCRPSRSPSSVMRVTWSGSGGTSAGDLETVGVRRGRAKSAADRIQTASSTRVPAVL